MSEPFHIFLVEDNPGDAELIGELIKDTGIAHSLTWLDDGEKAITFFNEGGKADVIILDLKLPKIGGHEIVEYLRERRTNTTPIIILTGSDPPMEIENTGSDGIVCYLVKPMTLKEMERMTLVLKEIILDSLPSNY